MTAQILVPLYTLPDGNTECLAVHVAAFAGQLEADVNLLAHVVTIPNVTNIFGTALSDLPKLVAEAQASCRARGRLLERSIAAATEPSGIRVSKKEIESYSETFGDAAAFEARYNDLVLVGIRRGSPALTDVAQGLIFGSGRAIIVMPEEQDPSLADRIMIAWDGSRAAARAVLDSMNILRRAHAVTVVTVTGEKALSSNSGARLVEYLSAHRVKAHVTSVELQERSIGAVLWEQAALSESNFVVMGAFGHSRLREFVLGGATRDVLHDMQLPVLFAH